MATELETNAKTQKELESDLTTTKHELLAIQAQMNLAEKELERKFSQTGAYKNFFRLRRANAVSEVSSLIIKHIMNRHVCHKCIYVT